MSTGKRYGKDVKEKILETALKVWEENTTNLSIKEVATRLGMNHANVYYHFPQGLQDAVAEYALEKNNIKVVTSLIVSGHHLAEKLSPSEKLEYLSKSI